jgi:hypothetical protein
MGPSLSLTENDSRAFAQIGLSSGLGPHLDFGDKSGNVFVEIRSCPTET